ncbi:MAG: hypothetical protein HN764_17735 [Gammaproteobacteria bacterium]|jgi:hypothetical protein|nr:hypothetical protein [Gammaproteobacteria bacterium]
MKQNNRLITFIFSCFLIMILTAGTLASESFKECIPAETVHAFLSSQFGRETNLNPEIPESFPKFVLPPHFRVLGSSSVEGHVSVALSSTLARQNADEALMTNFEEDGWRVVKPHSSADEVGFVEKLDRAVTYKTLCHDDWGHLEYTSVQMSSSSVITMGKYPSGYIYELNCQDDDPTWHKTQIPYMGRHLPRLVIPLNSANGRGGGTSSSGEFSRTSMRIKTELTSSEIFKHFSDQIKAQNWKRDASWKGDISEGATWTRQVDDKLELAGTFSVVVMNDSKYSIEFSLMPRSDAYR